MRVEANKKRLGGNRLNSGNTSGSVSDCLAANWRGGLAGYLGIVVFTSVSIIQTRATLEIMPTTNEKEADFRQMMGITFTTTILSLIMVVIYGSRKR
jgi:hypothetical protein